MEIGDIFGKMVIEVKSIEKFFDDNLIILFFFICILRGDCIGIIGFNGLGKIMLLNFLIGRIRLDVGKVCLGINFILVFVE